MCEKNMPLRESILNKIVIYVHSMCKVLENRSQQDEERMDQLTNQLKEARLLAEDADGKSDEVSRKLAFVEDELEVAEDRVKSGEAKIMELEEELKVWLAYKRLY